LEGAPINDAVVKLFEATTTVMWLQLWHSKVSVTAVDSLKQQRPHIEIYLRNRALMGVGCEDHAAGAIVKTVAPGTAAEAAGILPGDIVTHINGNTIPDFDRLTANVAQHEPGEQITLDVLRGEETHKINITLGSWDLRQSN
jgi:S1-C subfamily serine protease